jgi:carbon-monoxide dehydrogenase medium subunit
MIPVEFAYERATSIDDAIAKLAASGGKALAGGHSLVPLMKLRLSEPGRLVDISRIPGLSGIKESGGGIGIGATTTHNEIASSKLLHDKCPMIAEAAAEIGDPQVRNRGTIGGSIAHADPAADFPAVMLALDADIHLKGKGGARTVKASQYFRGFYDVDLKDGELIVGVQFDPIRAAAYAKLHQKASHYAIVGVAAALHVKGGVIESARIGLTGATTHAMRLTSVEQALAGKKADGIAAACEGAAKDVTDVSGDLHASAEYRAAMISVFARRAVEKALARGQVLGA